MKIQFKSIVLRNLAGKTFLIIVVPFLFFALLEGLVRISGINVSTIHSNQLGADLPDWLATNDDWVSAARARIENGKTLEDTDINFQKNYIKDHLLEYRLRPNLNISCVNNFSQKEVDHNLQFKVTTNSLGYRTKEFSPRKKQIVKTAKCQEANS